MYPRPKRALLAYLRAAYGRIDLAGIRSADALLTLNEATRTQLSRTYGRDDAICTYAGVDTEFFRRYSDAEVQDLRDRVGPGPVVVHSTDFSPIKRTDLALEAFAVAHQSVPDARLVVTSTREDPAVLEALRAQARRLGIADAFTYLGFLPFADLPRLYSLADVLLQTGTSAVSGATTMSLPVKEALATETPVVRSGVTGEDVVDGVSGFLVDPTDARQTGDRLIQILADPARARAMGAAGRERITATYVWDRVVDVVERAVDGA
jgi:phosphatidylinositol alpha-1,6-mannosyltransferase